MRILKEFNHKNYKCTLYQWSNRFIIKIESGPFEQNYKFDSHHFSSQEEFQKKIEQDLLPSVDYVFGEMLKASSKIID